MVPAVVDSIVVVGVLKNCVCVCVGGGGPHGVMVNAMDCGIVVSEFELQPCYCSLLDKYPWERYKPPYPPSYGLNSSTIVLLDEWLWH